MVAERIEGSHARDNTESRGGVLHRKRHQSSDRPGEGQTSENRNRSTQDGVSNKRGSKKDL